MIKDSGVLREPRGLSWQNWTASCKDVVLQHIKLLSIVSIVLFALAGVAAFNKQAHSVYGHFQKSHGPPGIRLNLNENPSPAVPDTKLTASVSKPPASSGKHSEGNPAAAPVSPTDTRQQATVPRTSNRGPGSFSASLCTTDATKNAQYVYDQSVAAENTYHQARLNAINTATSFGTLLGGGDYSKLLNTENDRHKTSLDLIVSTLRTTLDAFGC
jgi:hypothetical protein